MTSAISLQSVTKTYGEGTAATVAVDKVDLHVPAGTFVSLIGPSGCGKSTLLRLMAGLDTADHGSVRILDMTPAEACAAKLIGLVPQTPALLPWLSVQKNVALPQRINRGADRRRSRVGNLRKRERPEANLQKLLDQAGLGSVIHKLPAQLSGGMQQRVAIVRAFGLQPDVLLMDEPFAALDEFTRESLQNQLLDLWDTLKTTVVFVTHSVTEAVRLSDSVVVMAPHPGRVVDVVDIDIPRPRNERVFAEHRFHEYEDLVRDKLRNAWRPTDADEAVQV